MDLVGGNCAAGSALSRKFVVTLFGCASHRFSLAVKFKLKLSPTLLKKVRAIIKKVKYGFLTALLRKFFLP